MTLRNPPAVLDAVSALFAVYQATTWPPLLADGGQDLNTDGVQVLFGDLLEQPPRELVAVTGRVTDESQEWLGSGLPGKREYFTTLVVIMTYLPNRTALEAWARLRTLVHTAAGALRDLNTGSPIIPPAAVAAGVYSWGVSGIETTPFPIKDVGHVASAGLTITVKADI